MYILWRPDSKERWNCFEMESAASNEEISELVFDKLEENYWGVEWKRSEFPTEDWLLDRVRDINTQIDYLKNSMIFYKSQLIESKFMKEQ